MDSSDLILKRSVDETVSRKHGLALELGRNNNSLESLSTATYYKSKRLAKNCPMETKTETVPPGYDAIRNRSIPDRSSTSTCCACSVSISLFFSESAVIPEVSAMASNVAGERAVRENEARWVDV
jgi:hypothetical protein